MEIKLAAYLQQDSIVDGEGIRTVIWTQGCPHNCFGCHNPSTHNFNGGALVPLEEVYSIIDNLEGQDGITFSGGDPFVQAEPCAKIAEYARLKGYNIWCYTGYVFEDLIKMSNQKPEIMEFLTKIDILVDGKFDITKRSYNLKFAGSSNQRILDVPKSLLFQRAVLANKYLPEEELTTYNKPCGIYI